MMEAVTVYKYTSQATIWADSISSKANSVFVKKIEFLKCFFSHIG